MPELPDVENFKKYFDTYGVSRRVLGTSVRDESILEDTSKQKLYRALKGNRFTETVRHGKFLLAHISDDRWLAMHFGMTGSLKHYGNGSEPKYAKVIFHLDDETYLAYVCTRKLGKIKLTDSVQDLIASEDLGPDAMDKDLSKQDFIDRFQGKSAQLKSLLMDQSFIAGIGNIYADEILYQAGIHPEKSADSLDDEEIGNLYRTMRRVFRVANNHEGDIDDLPDGYLLPHRSEGAACPKCRGSVEKITVSGRSTYYCPECQKK